MKKLLLSLLGVTIISNTTTQVVSCSSSLWPWERNDSIELIDLQDVVSKNADKWESYIKNQEWWWPNNLALTKDSVSVWFQSHISTYLTQDIANVLNMTDLSDLEIKMDNLDSLDYNYWSVSPKISISASPNSKFFTGSGIIELAYQYGRILPTEISMLFDNDDVKYRDAFTKILNNDSIDFNNLKSEMVLYFFDRYSFIMNKDNASELISIDEKTGIKRSDDSVIGIWLTYSLNKRGQLLPAKDWQIWIYN